MNLSEKCWKDPSVAKQQALLARRELAEWKAGAPHGPFDALAALTRALDRRIRILEVGCGAGYNAVVLRDLGFPFYTGLDWSEAMIERAEGWALPAARFIVMDILGKDDPLGQRLELRSFDLVIEGCVMLHAETLAEARRVLSICAGLSSRYVLLHRTPVRPEGKPSVSVVADVYGLPCTRWDFSGEDVQAMVEAAGLAKVSEHRWNVGCDPEIVSALCEVVK